MRKIYYNIGQKNGAQVLNTIVTFDQIPFTVKEFEEKIAQDKAFANDQNAILTWFYSKTKFYDDRYLLYPIGREF